MEAKQTQNTAVVTLICFNASLRCHQLHAHTETGYTHTLRQIRVLPRPPAENGQIGSKQWQRCTGGNSVTQDGITSGISSVQGNHMLCIPSSCL